MVEKIIDIELKAVSLNDSTNSSELDENTLNDDMGDTSLNEKLSESVENEKKEHSMERKFYKRALNFVVGFLNKGIKKADSSESAENAEEVIKKRKIKQIKKRFIANSKKGIENRINRRNTFKRK